MKSTTEPAENYLKSNKYIKAEKLAEDVMSLSGSSLLVNFRFLDMSLNRLKRKPILHFPYAVNGHNMFYDPLTVLKDYSNERELPIRNYLHMLLHCIFRHMYVCGGLDQPIWNLACDIAVENLINDLNTQALKAKRAAAQEQVIAELKEQVKYITAEYLYKHFMEEQISDEKLVKLQKLFKADEHMLWYAVERTDVSDNGDSNNGNADNGKSNNGSANNGDSINGNAGSRNVGNEIAELESAMVNPADEQAWQEISERMQMELEAFLEIGDKAGSMRQSLELLNRERYDYSDFLKKFAVRNEIMRINDDEFDYIYYTYGLRLFEKMPLVEPLEYKEVNKIREFVIAIDTSGSVSGELVQRFMQKTFNILKSTESFFSKIDLHIIQCDAAIQEDEVIHTEEEFDNYIGSMELKGFGGTDFRPVFSYVDELRKKGQLRKLKGLIYFTDGIGVYPDRMPDYNTAFVFLDRDCRNPEVPSWAIKLVLDEDEL